MFVALEQMLVRAAISNDFATTGLQALRNQCKGRRLKLKVKDPPRQLVVADLFWSPFHFDVIPADLAAAPQLPQLVLELMRYVLMRLGGSYSCVTRYTGGPSHFSYIIHLRFHSPPQDAFGTLTPTRRIVEIVLLKLRTRDVPGLLADLRAANLSKRRAARAARSTAATATTPSPTSTSSPSSAATPPAAPHNNNNSSPSTPNP